MKIGLPRLEMKGSPVGVLALAALLMLVACTTEPQRIEESNEAAGLSPTIVASSSSITIQRSGKINIFEVRNSDCVKSLADGSETSLAEIVSCTEDWEIRVVSSFVAGSFAKYPGNAYFWKQARTKCDRRYSFLISPSKESWELGDRVVNCLQDRFGLEIAELDRMVSPATLRDEECINDVPESKFLLVELVDCLGDWDMKILSTFEVTPDGPYPGEDYIARQASNICAMEADITFMPTASTWQDEGDRIVTCAIGRRPA